MTKWPGPSEDEGRVLVPTHCLYPSNGVVSVVVEGGADRFRVHDDGAALDELESAMGVVPYPLSIMRAATRRQGVEVTDAGVIFAPLTNFADLAATIILVANASKDAANRLIDSMKPRPRRNFRFELEKLLESEFGHMPLRRASSVIGLRKPHKFDYVVHVSEQRQLLLDAVMPEASSINAAVVAHLDVRQAKLRNVVQRIVYDDEETWKAEDLDFGCGIGRTAAPLAAFLTAGRLVGNDMVPAQIHFCEAEIAGRFANAEFHCVRAQNPHYDHRVSAAGVPMTGEVEFFAAHRETFDVTAALSVFTHFDRDMAAHYLGKLREVTKPGGHLFLTWFLDHPANPSDHRLDGRDFADLSGGDLGLALFSPGLVHQLADTAELRVERLTFGWWRGGPTHAIRGQHYQDSAVLARP
jgi:SAM-dependent methyltransferase